MKFKCKTGELPVIFSTGPAISFLVMLLILISCSPDEKDFVTENQPMVGQNLVKSETVKPTINDYSDTVPQKTDSSIPHSSDNVDYSLNSSKTEEALYNLLPIEARVIEVVSGQTIKVRIDDSVYVVSYLGVDISELTDSSLEEATSFNAFMVLDKEVYLVQDNFMSEDETLNLVYAYVAGELVNLRIISQGLAKVKYYNSAFELENQFTQAESDSRSRRLGQWSGIWNQGLRGEVDPLKWVPPVSCGTLPCRK